jgi:Protein of unknown function (DUF1579)
MTAITGMHQRAPVAIPALERLDVMVGRWEVNGRELGSGAAVHGQVEFEWLDGGFYLVQRVETEYGGRRVTGAEYIGYDGDNRNLKSYFFSNDGPGPFGGVALEYVWEIADDGLTIWSGFEGSPARFSGTFSDDRNTISGRWEWPGGGYESTMTRVE